MSEIVVVESGLSVQHCWLSRALFKSTGSKFGQNAVLSIGHTKYLCQLWPREDFIDGYVELQTGVSELTEHMKSSLASSRLSAECIELQSIQSVKTVSVSVILSDLKKVSQYKRNPSAGKLEDAIKTILREVSFKENFCMRCHDTPLGKLHGIAYLIINKLPKNVQCGRIKPSAKITVDNIMSLNKFKQKYFHQNECNPVGGFEKLIGELREFVERAHKHEDPMLPRGCLLHGPSGSGKTSLVRHVASVTDAYMVRVKGAEVIGARPGDTERNLSRLFEEARDMSEEGACILFLDELDALAGSKGKGESSMSGRTLSHLLHLLDDSVARKYVVIAATSHLQAINQRLRQAGRLDIELLVGVPDYEQREAMLRVLLSAVPCREDPVSIAEKTPGYLPADLASLVQCAARRAANKHAQEVGQAEMTAALHEVRPASQRGSEVIAHHKPVAWTDIGGLEDVKLQLQQAIEWPLRHPAAFQRMGIPRPKGVLLTGPPGCAKTLLVRAAASACHVTFLTLSAAQLYSPYVGQAESKIREVFHEARMGAPSILFIDEVDCVVGKRAEGQASKGVQERVLSTLLNEMDGIGHNADTEVSAGGDGDVGGGVIVVAATNRPDMMDDAILRPGRIDRIIKVPMPDLQTRQKILEVHTKKMPLDNVDLQKIAQETNGFTGAQLEDLCRESALAAMFENGGFAVRPVQHRHMEEVLTQCRTPVL